ncbi:Chorismate--pyruvate lyase [Rubellimicrobium mesophilum DSM 19309]|uniref:Chorismate--pyruvate lyase n=1 Tax=Rubellimicrobium mesophilum DSM 19309 TaxID=442562 RepID=A0A017HU44_9RHOB|nr:chorismate lyase [Rubellimicrobium mesophilum]EYD77663.1 Chorismate--pyruvate lyase [Rubellimicrobium mesophilum DSM 19309]
MTEAWHDLDGRTRLALPPRIRDWLALGSSMTAQVALAAGGPVDVEVLRQGPGRLLPDERHFFPGAIGPATVREVCLSVRGRPLLVARTVLTSRRLQAHPTIRNLGTRALGSLLFVDGPPAWTARQVALLGPGAPLFGLVRQRHPGIAGGYWARRTLYRLFGEPLLVTEVLLPELVHLAAARTEPPPERTRRAG